MSLAPVFIDVGPDDRLRAIGVLTSMRDQFAEVPSRYGEAMAHAMNVLVAAAAGAGNAEADALTGIARASAGHRSLGGYREVEA